MSTQDYMTTCTGCQQQPSYCDCSKHPFERLIDAITDLADAVRGRSAEDGHADTTD